MTAVGFDAASLISGMIAQEAGSLAALVKKLGRGRYDELVSSFPAAFKDHLATTHTKCSRVKTILNRDNAIDLYSLYVKVVFLNQGHLSTDDYVLGRLKNTSPAIVVSGLAGCGKTMFLRWVALELTAALPETGRIPLYVELRELSETDLGGNLEKMIFSYTSSEQSSRTFEQFRLAIQHGLFVVILDGLDEVAPQSREKVLTELAAFPRRYPKCPILISTRPDERVEGMGSVSMFHVRDMSLDQIRDVVQKSPFDDNKKKEFIKRLNDGLLDEHRTFLSNPLLTTIMLMTFDNSTALPDRKTTFYQLAFETLFYKHDSSKGVYARVHYAGLPIDEFERFLRRFCFVTYLKSRYAFPFQDIVEEIRSALIIEGMKENSYSDLVRDLTETLCLMQRDGLLFTFVHRSFQEYFSARFLFYYRGNKLGNFLAGLAARVSSDNVIPMLYEIDSTSVLKSWVIPSVRGEYEHIRQILEGPPEAIKHYITTFISEAQLTISSGSAVVETWMGSEKLNTFMNLSAAGCPVLKIIKDTVSGQLTGAIDERILSEIKKELKIIWDLDDIRKKEGRDRLLIELARLSPALLEEMGMKKVLEEIAKQLQEWVDIASAKLDQSRSTDDALVGLLEG